MPENTTGCQTKKKSMLESFVNTIIGLITSFLGQLLLFPYLGIPVSMTNNVIITLFFFCISFTRGYLIRRYFNKH